MAIPVHFARLGVGDAGENLITKIQRLYDEAGFGDFIHEGDLTAIKLHFGERGNNSYINPTYVRQVVDKIKASGGNPFITDTNTLYFGARHNSVDHILTAIEHGFAYAVVGAPLIVADGLASEHYRDVVINKKHFTTVKIAGDIVASRSMIVMSHFKAHTQAGFGGAIKNLGMGCAPRAGKMDQHSSLQPLVYSDACTQCGVCVEACPRSAISSDENGTHINYELCIGCGDCTKACSTSSIKFDWERDIPTFTEMLTEYAYGAIAGKHGRVGYLNFLLQITPDCDCVPWSDSPIVPDIGILAATDPVAIDAASVDLVNQQRGSKGTRLSSNLEPGRDKFKGVWKETDGQTQLRYGEEIGLGRKTYKLIEL